MKKVILILAATTILFVGYILVRASFHKNLPISLPEVVGDANPVLRTERRFNDSISVVKRNETISTIGSKWKNYYKDGEWLDIDTTLIQTPDGFCADKMPFKFCAPLRSTGEAIFTANNQYNIFKQEVITDAPLEERLTAVGVNDVLGQLITGNLMMSNGKYEDVQYVLYPGAYNDADLIYYINYASAPRLAQLVRWNIAPTCSLPLTRTFISKYSAPVEITNAETRVKWNKTGQFLTDGEPLRIASSDTRGAGKKPFQIWDSNEKGIFPNRQRIDVKIINSPGQNAYALTKILPCAFFSSATYPVYTDTTSVFNPDADPETSTVDGTTIDNTDGQSWADKRAAAGDVTADASATLPIEINDRETAGNGFRDVYRSFISFNTGPTVPVADTVSSSTLKLRISSSNFVNNLGNNIDAALTGTTATFTTALEANGGDYDTVTSVRNADVDVLFAEMAVGDDEFWELNSTGMNNIAKGSGITRYALQTDWDLADSPVPATSDNSTQEADAVRFTSAESATDPELTVIHAVAEAAGEDEGDIIEFMYWKLYDFKVFAYYNLVNPLINTAYAFNKKSE